jgi:hypothetical protein
MMSRKVFNESKYGEIELPLPTFARQTHRATKAHRYVSLVINSPLKTPDLNSPSGQSFDFSQPLNKHEAFSVQESFLLGNPSPSLNLLSTKANLSKKLAVKKKKLAQLSPFSGFASLKNSKSNIVSD